MCWMCIMSQFCNEKKKLLSDVFCWIPATKPWIVVLTKRKKNGNLMKVWCRKWNTNMSWQQYNNWFQSFFFLRSQKLGFVFLYASSVIFTICFAFAGWSTFFIVFLWSFIVVNNLQWLYNEKRKWENPYCISLSRPS